MQPSPITKLSDAEINNATLQEFLGLLGKKNLRPGGSHGFRQAAAHLEATAIGRTLVWSLDPPDSGTIQGQVRWLPGFETLEDLPAPESVDGIFVESQMTLLNAAFPERCVDLLAHLVRALRPGGVFVLHEFAWRQAPPPDLLAEVPNIWRIPFAPLTVPDWWRMAREAGGEAISSEVGALPWLRRKQMLRDEGGDNAAEFFFNALDHPAARKRFLDAYDHFAARERWYGSLVLGARKPLG